MQRHKRLPQRLHFPAGLGLNWVVRPDVELGAVLRIARDSEGEQLLFTSEEVEVQARQAAERRVAELEAELRKRSP